MDPRDKNVIKTTPSSGLYEGGTTPPEQKPKKANPSDITTDLQNNGYPLTNQNKIPNTPLDKL